MEDGYREISRPTAIYALETVRHEESTPSRAFFLRVTAECPSNRTDSAHTQESNRKALKKSDRTMQAYAASS